MRKLVWAMLAAGVILIILLMYPSFECMVNRDQITVSPVEAFVVSVPEGYAVGFSFNLTNLTGCQLTAESIHVAVREAVYPDGSRAALELSESGPLTNTVMPNESSRVSYVFDQYFARRPVKLLLKIEIAFSGTGRMTVFDGELNVPPLR